MYICIYVYMYICIYVYMYIQLPCGPSPPPCLLRSLFSVSPSPCLPVSLSPCLPVALSPCLCFFRVKVLQKPNPPNHKNCKKKHPKLCKNHAKSTPLGSFWGDFGVILVPLGVLWRPWAPQGTPQGSRGEKTTKKGVRRPPPGTPFGDPWATLGAIGPTFSSFLGVG